MKESNKDKPKEEEEEKEEEWGGEESIIIVYGQKEKERIKELVSVIE